MSLLIQDKGTEIYVVETTEDAAPEVYTFDLEDIETVHENLQDLFELILDSFDLKEIFKVRVMELAEPEIIKESHALDNYDHDRTGRGGDTVSKLLHDLACKLSEKCEHGHRFSDHPACLRRELGLEVL